MDILVNKVNLFAVIISLRALNFYLIKAFEPVFELRRNCTTTKGNSIKNYLFVGLLGFEPRMTESKSEVLPLHHNPINYSK